MPNSTSFIHRNPVRVLRHIAHSDLAIIHGELGFDSSNSVDVSLALQVVSDLAGLTDQLATDLGEASLEALAAARRLVVAAPSAAPGLRECLASDEARKLQDAIDASALVSDIERPFYDQVVENVRDAVHDLRSTAPAASKFEAELLAGSIERRLLPVLDAGSQKGLCFATDGLACDVIGRVANYHLRWRVRGTPAVIQLVADVAGLFCWEIGAASLAARELPRIRNTAKDFLAIEQ